MTWVMAREYGLIESTKGAMPLHVGFHWVFLSCGIRLGWNLTLSLKGMCVDEGEMCENEI